MASALARLREMAALLDPSSLEETWETPAEAEPLPDYQSELFLPALVTRMAEEVEEIAPEPPLNEHVDQLGRLAENWSLPKLSVDKPRIRQVPGVHWLSEAAYRPIELTARALGVSHRGLTEAGAHTAELLTGVGRVARIGIWLPFVAVARLDIVGVLAMLFTVTGVVVALSLALR